MIDSVKLFFEKFKIHADDFIQFGIDNIIWCDAEDTYNNWLDLKEKILKKENYH